MCVCDRAGLVERHEIDGPAPSVHRLSDELLAAAVIAKVAVGMKTVDGVAVLSCPIASALLSSLDDNRLPLPLICAKRGKRSIT